ncbi:hypothetical protein [Bernardetia sp.]|uniref:hypothetical protein n=1 Tax=Bernardetia sp. TaxID=1937974 RepID=UPI0025BB4D95|nr:hypothetical protein [Bernardetia sp.]
MENQTPHPSPAIQETPSRTAELLKEYFQSASSSKTAYSFLKVLAILAIASYLISSMAESEMRFTFPIVALLYIVFVFGQIIIKENDSKLKKANILAKTLTAVTAQYKMLEESLESYKEANTKGMAVLKEVEKDLAYYKAENKNLTENFHGLESHYNMTKGQLEQAQKSIAKHKSEKENFDKIISKKQYEAYVKGCNDVEELNKLNRSIPQTKDEDKKSFDTKVRDELDKKITKAKAWAADNQK